MPCFWIISITFLKRGVFTLTLNEGEKKPVTFEFHIQDELFENI